MSSSPKGPCTHLPACLRRHNPSLHVVLEPDCSWRTHTLEKEQAMLAHHVCCAALVRQELQPSSDKENAKSVGDRSPAHVSRQPSPNS
eukprot:3569897-Amphidinium_carterae.2